MSISSCEYVKFPPLGLIITTKFYDNSKDFFIVPYDGVVPPSYRLSHNSTRSAPYSNANLAYK